MKSKKKDGELPSFHCKTLNLFLKNSLSINFLDDRCTLVERKIKNIYKRKKEFKVLF
jgi:hypothetical protein